MPENSVLSLAAFINMTDDAMLVLDPHDRVVRFASPRAVDLVGPVEEAGGTSFDDLFSDADGRLNVFLKTAISVSDPVVSTVTLAGDNSVLNVKARRLSVSGGRPAVLMQLDADPALTNRFRLLSQNMSELTRENSRRISAEQRLSKNLVALRRALSIIRQFSEIDTSSGDHAAVAAAAIDSALGTSGTAIMLERFGRLHIVAATGAFAGAFNRDQQLDFPFGEFTRIWRDHPQRRAATVLDSLRRHAKNCLDPDGALLLPLSVSGGFRGVLVILPGPGSRSQPDALLEGDLIVEALGSLIARAEIEARLVHAQKLQAIGQLTGGIAHDFNNILSVVLGNAELLLDEMGGIDLEFAREIRDAAMRGATLTSRLLAFARKQPLRPETLAINGLLRDMDPLIRRSISEQIEFELVSGGGLWEAHVDRSQFENAVLNLVVNARDAMPDGGSLTVETANARLDEEYASQHAEVTAGQYVMVAVSDTGGGMKPEVAQEAFTPFFTTKAVGKGSGLGLSMVFGFVKQSKGHVKIYSEPGVGTTIRMYFPRDLSKLDASGGEAALQPADTPRGKGRILVVEDDPGVLKHLEKSLVILGYSAQGVLTGDHAVTLLNQETFDLMLTDVVLPGSLDGARLAAVAAGIAPSMPVLFMSGYTENAILHHGRLDPGVELISKPFTREQLAKRLKAMIPG